MESDILASGIYCTTCGYFEDEDNLVGGSCNGCGCPESNHVHAVIKEV